MTFRDRESAGEQLAERLSPEWKARGPVVLALPRGGVPVAYPIARRLDAPLDLLLVRKLGAPSNPELALGAVAEDGEPWMNRDVLASLSPRADELEQLAARALREMRRQESVFRAGRPRLPLRGRSVLIVDDGLATGATMAAAVRSARARGATEIGIAAPVGARDAVDFLRTQVDELVVLSVPAGFLAVGEWYEDFDQVTDEDVIRLLGAGQEVPRGRILRKDFPLGLRGVSLLGELTRPERCRAWVIFAHGSGSSRKSPRNAQVARALNEAGFGTLLFDLLTPDEARDRRNVFDVDRLAERLRDASEWLARRPEAAGLPIGYFGASTGAAAALQACAQAPTGEIFAVVSRGGRPDLAGESSLGKVQAPVLLIVGSEDRGVLELNLRARARLAHARIELVPGATHLFEEAGALEHVGRMAAGFFGEALERAGALESA